jgi:hypothetical protein
MAATSGTAGEPKAARRMSSMGVAGLASKMRPSDNRAWTSVRGEASRIPASPAGGWWGTVIGGLHEAG